MQIKLTKEAIEGILQALTSVSRGNNSDNYCENNLEIILNFAPESCSREEQNACSPKESFTSNNNDDSRNGEYDILETLGEEYLVDALNINNNLISTHRDISSTQHLNAFVCDVEEIIRLLNQYEQVMVDSLFNNMISNLDSSVKSISCEDEAENEDGRLALLDRNDIPVPVPYFLDNFSKKAISEVNSVIAQFMYTVDTMPHILNKKVNQVTIYHSFPEMQLLLRKIITSLIELSGELKVLLSQYFQESELCSKSNIKFNPNNLDKPQPKAGSKSNEAILLTSRHIFQFLKIIQNLSPCMDEMIESKKEQNTLNEIETSVVEHSPKKIVSPKESTNNSRDFVEVNKQRSNNIVLGIGESPWSAYDSNYSNEHSEVNCQKVGIQQVNSSVNKPSTEKQKDVQGKEKRTRKPIFTSSVVSASFSRALATSNAPMKREQLQPMKKMPRNIQDQKGMREGRKNFKYSEQTKNDLSDLHNWENKFSIENKAKSTLSRRQSDSQLQINPNSPPFQLRRTTTEAFTINEQLDKMRQALETYKECLSKGTTCSLLRQTSFAKPTANNSQMSNDSKNSVGSSGQSALSSVLQDQASTPTRIEADSAVGNKSVHLEDLVKNMNSEVKHSHTKKNDFECPNEGLETPDRSVAPLNNMLAQSELLNVSIPSSNLVEVGKNIRCDDHAKTPKKEEKQMLSDKNDFQYSNKSEPPVEIFTILNELVQGSDSMLHDPDYVLQQSADSVFVVQNETFQNSEQPIAIHQYRSGTGTTTKVSENDSITQNSEIYEKILVTLNTEEKKRNSKKSCQSEIFQTTQEISSLMTQSNRGISCSSMDVNKTQAPNQYLESAAFVPSSSFGFASPSKRKSENELSSTKMRNKTRNQEQYAVNSKTEKKQSIQRQSDRKGTAIAETANKGRSLKADSSKVIKSVAHQTFAQPVVQGCQRYQDTANDNKDSENDCISQNSEIYEKIIFALNTEEKKAFNRRTHPNATERRPLPSVGARLKDSQNIPDKKQHSAKSAHARGTCKPANPPVKKPIHAKSKTNQNQKSSIKLNQVIENPKSTADIQSQEHIETRKSKAHLESEKRIETRKSKEHLESQEHIETRKSKAHLESQERIETRKSKAHLESQEHIETRKSKEHLESQEYIETQKSKAHLESQEHIETQKSKARLESQEYSLKTTTKSCNTELTKTQIESLDKLEMFPAVSEDSKPVKSGMLPKTKSLILKSLKKLSCGDEEKLETDLTTQNATNTSDAKTGSLFLKDHREKDIKSKHSLESGYGVSESVGQNRVKERGEIMSKSSEEKRKNFFLSERTSEEKIPFGDEMELDQKSEEKVTVENSKVSSERKSITKKGEHRPMSKTAYNLKFYCRRNSEGDPIKSLVDSLNDLGMELVRAGDQRSVIEVLHLNIYLTEVIPKIMILFEPKDMLENVRCLSHSAAYFRNALSVLHQSVFSRDLTLTLESMIKHLLSLIQKFLDVSFECTKRSGRNKKILRHWMFIVSNEKSRELFSQKPDPRIRRIENTCQCAIHRMNKKTAKESRIIAPDGYDTWQINYNSAHSKHIGSVNMVNSLFANANWNSVRRFYRTEVQLDSGDTMLMNDTTFIRSVKRIPLKPDPVACYRYFKTFTANSH